MLAHIADDGFDFLLVFPFADQQHIARVHDNEIIEPVQHDQFILVIDADQVVGGIIDDGFALHGIPQIILLQVFVHRAPGAQVAPVK